MSMEEIMEAIRKLSYSNGSYGRLYEQLAFLRDNKPDEYADISGELEAQGFGSAVDLIMYLEG